MFGYNFLKHHSLSARFVSTFSCCLSPPTLHRYRLSPTLIILCLPGLRLDLLSSLCVASYRLVVPPIRNRLLTLSFGNRVRAAAATATRTRGGIGGRGCRHSCCWHPTVYTQQFDGNCDNNNSRCSSSSRRRCHIGSHKHNNRWRLDRARGSA